MNKEPKGEAHGSLTRFWLLVSARDSIGGARLAGSDLEAGFRVACLEGFGARVPDFASVLAAAFCREASPSRCRASRSAGTSLPADAFLARWALGLIIACNQRGSADLVKRRLI